MFDSIKQKLKQINLNDSTRYRKAGVLILLINDIESKKRFIAIAHDTGSAIKGQNRIDLFTGFGHDAESLASGLNKKVSVKKLKPIAK